MKISCEIIKDLLPLYVDGVCSEESKKLVEKHLKECDSCREEYELLNDNIHMNQPKFDETKIVEEASKVLKKEKRKSFIIGEIVLVLICIIPIIFISLTSFNPSNVYFESKGANYNKATLKVSYDTPFYVCTYEEDEKLDYNYNGQEVTITCTNKFISDKKYTVKENVYGLYELSNSFPICELGDRWMKAGIPDSMVAIYRRIPSKKYNNVSGAYYVIVKTEEGYKSFIEDNIYSDLYSYDKPVLFKYENKLKYGAIEIEDYKLIDNLDEFKNQIKNEGFKLVVEDYENGLSFWTCH